jgi:hypothetical protein
MKVFVRVNNQNRIMYHIPASSLAEARRIDNRLAPILRLRLEDLDKVNLDEIMDEWTNVVDFARIRETTPHESNTYWARQSTVAESEVDP